LTADGTGATYWAIPSSLGGIPAFNEIITSAGTYTADLSYNRFRLLAGEGIGMTNGPAGSNQTSLYSKAFSEVDVSGDNSFYAFTSNTVTPIIRFAATGAIQVRSDPATNTLFIDGPKTAPYIVSTGIYGFSQIKVTPEASTITSSLQGWSGDYITANSPSTLLRFIGYNDIQLSTNVTTNSVFFTISTFNSADYLNISTAAYSAYPNAISTVSSLYTSLTLFNSSFNYLSSLDGASYSTLESTINGIAMSTGTEFYILTGLINARATIIQLNTEISNVNLNIQSTSIGLGTLGYISTGGGSVVGQDQLYSTVIGLGSAGYVSTLSLVSTVAGLQSTINNSYSTFSTAVGPGGIDLIRSTVTGLGSSGYVSSLSTIITSTIFNTGAISTYSLEVFGPATLTNSGSTILRGPVNIQGQTYFAGNVTFAQTSSFLSNIPIISTQQLQTSSIQTFFLSTLVLNVSSINGALPGTGSGNGSSITVSTAQIVASSIQAPTVSTQALNLSSINGANFANILPSTVTGLGAAGYISSASLTSTVTGLGATGYISSPSLTSTITGLGAAGYISSPSLTSTVTGLGAAGYISSASLTSTVTGLGATGYISSPSLISTVTGLGAAGYISSPSLTSTVNSLATIGYISSASLTSSLRGLGTLGYISSLAGVGSGAVPFISALTTSTGSLYASSISFVNVNPSTTNLWVAVGSDTIQNIKYSSDGINWSSASGSKVFTNAGAGVAWNGRMWVAVGNDSTQNIKYSYDGINWFNAAGAKAFGGIGYAVAWNGRLWVAVGGDTTQNVKYSSDGINWTSAAGSIVFNGQVGYGVAWSGSMWVAVGSDSIQSVKYSYNGINWFSAAGSQVFFDEIGYAVAWNGRLWVAVGLDTSIQCVKYSSDGINWFNAAGSMVFGNQVGYAVAWNGRMWVALGDDSTQCVKYSYDGINWLNASGSQVFGSNIGYAAAWNGNLWVALGSDTTQPVEYSYNGINWLPAAGAKIFNGNNGYAVAYSSNVIPSYNQTNFEIEPQNIPIFLRSTNTMSFLESTIILNNTLFIDETNRVGINTGNPTVDLDVNGIIRTAGISTIYFQTSSFVTAIVSSLSFQTSSFVTPIVSTLRTQTSSLTFGNGIGWVTAGAFQAVAVSSIQMNTALGYVSSLYVGSTNSVTLPFYTARVNGNALISSLLVGQPVNTFSSIGFRLAITHDSAVKPGSASWTTTSDMRVKENIVNANVDQCYSDIKSLALRRFTWQSTFFQEWDGEDRRVLGFVAQEVSSIMPKSVKVMPAYGYSDFQFINIDQINMALYGAVKKTIEDKEILESTVKGQTFELETLRGTTTFILSTLRGIQNQ
jgi:hypothetical protein